ncbi:unnamed protein product [Hymenolepis diminuta]|uniref:Uncharacterized protein n=1 Tax=Hymenolepis diminuta TaxID=6216 RepID=A0A564YTT7_HYMDI|nr:unnamed protein product [Hymenolepis diminuta]
MKAFLSALPKDTRSRLQLKGTIEASDYDYAKPNILNLMSVTERTRAMSDFFQRKQQPGESYAQFAMALQAILVEATGNRFSPADQEYLVSNCFIAHVEPPSLQTQLRPLEHAGIVELIKAATNLSTSRGNPNQRETPPRLNNPTQPRTYPFRQSKPSRAIQGNQQFRNRLYLSSVINGSGLLGMDFLGKHQSRILLDKGKLILDGIFELTLGWERPSLGSCAVNTREPKTRKNTRAEKLLHELGDSPEEIKSFLIDNEDIFVLEGEPTGRSNIIKHIKDIGDAKPIALRPRRTPAQYQEFVREEITNLLKNKVIRPSSSA